jgi:hypothetical protein
MGLTMTVASMLSVIALSWATAKTPFMTQLALQRRWRELDASFWTVFGWSVACYVAGGLCFEVGLLAIQVTPYAERFLSPTQSAGLLFAMGCYHLTALFATYVRGHLKEPFFKLSMGGGLLTMLTSMWAAPQWGASGLISVLILFNAGLFLPVSIGIWSRVRRERASDFS